MLRKILLLSFLGFVLLMNAYTQNAGNISVNISNQTLKEFFAIIEQKYPYTFMYNNAEINDKQLISVKETNVTLNELLNEVFSGRGILYEIQGKQILLKSAQSKDVPSNKRTITGKVFDSSGEALIGVTVSVKGNTAIGTVTDVDGKYSLSDVPENATIVFDYIGLKPQEIADKGRTQIDVKMEEDAVKLQETVVIGYGTQRKANLTGAVSTVDVDKSLVAKSFTDIGKGLQGTVPGLQVTYSNGGITSSPTFQIRGLNSINGGNNPLIVVDGIVTDDITSIAPNDIASISVLKDAASTAIFGARAIGGVIMITTKSGQKNTKFTVNYTNNFSWGNPTVIPSFPDPLVELPMENAAMIRAGSPSFDFWGADVNDMITGITNWKQNYAGKESSNNMILGQDFSAVPNGAITFYRLWDPVKIMYQTMPAQNHNINFSGGTDKISYYVSGSYAYNEGLLKPNPQKVNTYNITANVNADATKWLNIQAKITDRQYNFNGPNVNSAYVGSDVLYSMWRWGAYVPYGTYTDPSSGKDYYWDSPLGWLKNAGTSTSQNNTVTSNFSATIKFTSWLNLHSDFSYIYGSTLANNYDGITPMYDFWGTPWTGSPVTKGTVMGNLYVTANSSPNSTNGLGDFYQTTFTTQITSNSYMTFDKKFGPHSLKAVIGLNAEKGEVKKFNGGGFNLTDPSRGEIAFLLNTDPYNATQRQLYGGVGAAPIADLTRYPEIGGDHTWWSVAGYFGRINYDYNNKYLLELNARYDGSSVFPVNGRWAFFPSASAGWRITEESFMKDVKKVISDWKIRASYGSLGNQYIGNNGFLPTMNPGVNSWLTQSSSFLSITTQPANIPASLTWERVNDLDLGTDMRFLNNNLGLTFDWYRKDNVGMLTESVEVPAVFGNNPATTNNGSMRTDGWELGLDYHYRLHNGIQLYANAALSNYVSKILKYTGNDGKLLNDYYVGQTIGTIWGFKTVGYFKDADDVANSPSQVGLQTGTFVFGPGDIKYADLNGDGKIDAGTGNYPTLTDHGDLTKIGNTTPRYQYSFRLGGDWKGVDLDAYFQGVGSCQMWATGNVPIPGYGGNGQFLGNQMDYWTPDNPNAQWPVPYYGNQLSTIQGESGSKGWALSAGVSGNNFYPQTKYLLNMAYLRLKTLSIGYTLPAQLTEKLEVSKFRIYVEGMNLLTSWANQIPIDPEVTSGAATAAAYYGVTYPFNKTYSFGVQITF